MERAFVAELERRLDEPAPLIQVILGPRQVGKTTGIRQLLARYSGPSHFISGDDALFVGHDWLLEHWQTAQRLGEGALLVVDEVQKLPDWSSAVKALWDRASKGRRPRCVLLGSSALALQKGLSESLTGRFEILRVYHWSFAEWRSLFPDDLGTYLRFGGYPGAQGFQHDFGRWFAYMRDAIVETVIGKDILALRSVAKPALFRQAFAMLCGYPAQEVSYSKLLGQLQDRGNTDLIKHYIELYEGAFLFSSLFKYAKATLAAKSSSPKIIAMAPSFYTLAAGEDALDTPEAYGRVFESAVGAELQRVVDGKVSYWREGKHEVDFVVQRGRKLYALEVKSGRKRLASGLSAFERLHPRAITAVITPENFAELAVDPGKFLASLA